MEWLRNSKNQSPPRSSIRLAQHLRTVQEIEDGARSTCCAKVAVIVLDVRGFDANHNLNGENESSLLSRLPPRVAGSQKEATKIHSPWGK
jgi:hypothetical protein